jgi:hypothetical protein
MTTGISNLIIPSELRDRAQVNLAKLLDFMSRGAAIRQDVGAGEFANMRGFNELSGDDEVLTDSSTHDVHSIDQHKDIAPVCHRIKNYGASDLAAIVSGADPMDAISRQIANYFANVANTALLKCLVGAFASGGPLNGTNFYDVYNNSSPVYLTPTTAVTGMAKIGDEMNNLGVIFMHSATFATLLKAGYLESNANLSAYGISNDGSVMTFMGRPVVVSDKCPLTVGTGTYPNEYTTFIAALGSLAMGIQKDVNPEVGRDEKNKKDFIATDFHFAPHVNGVKWNVATTNPTNTDLATGSNWALAYSNAKFVRVVAIKHN